MANAWVPKDPRQQEILRRLRLVGAAPATYFIDACRLMEKQHTVHRVRNISEDVAIELEAKFRTVREMAEPNSDAPA
jgi:hypothetical protein